MPGPKSVSVYIWRGPGKIFHKDVLSPTLHHDECLSELMGYHLLQEVPQPLSFCATAQKNWLLCDFTIFPTCPDVAAEWLE